MVISTKIKLEELLLRTWSYSQNQQHYYSTDLEFNPNHIIGGVSGRNPMIQLLLKN